MSTSKNHYSFVFPHPPGKKLSKEVTKILLYEALYLVNRLWNFSEKQNFNKSTALQFYFVKHSKYDNN